MLRSRIVRFRSGHVRGSDAAPRWARPAALARPGAATAIQQARAAVLRHLSPQVSDARRGQYEGYLSESGVAPDSTTETFFSMIVHVDTDSFRGVPFTLASGKALDVNLTEIKIFFKDGTDIVFNVP
ncbi:hypothetical protein B4Q13_23025, partial [Lacticaseibacillus rhamnosus]